MIKNIISILLILIIPIAASACWSSNDLNDIGIILGMGIDKDKQDKFEVTVQTVNPSSSNGSEGASKNSSYILHCAKGNSVFDAARNISKDASRKNYWPHAKLVILTEELAKEDIKPYLDFFTRDSQRRKTAYFVISNSSIKNIMSSEKDYDNVPSNEIIKLIEESSINGYGVKSNIRDFIKESEDVSGVSFMNCFTQNCPQDKIDKKSNNTLSNVGIFYKYKLIDFLSLEENRILNFIKNKIKNPVLTFEYEDKTFTLEVTKSKTKIKPKIEKGNYTIKSDTNIDFNIVEYSDNYNIENINKNDLTKTVENSLKSSIMQLFNKSKNIYKLDLFGFGNAFSYKYPNILNLSQDQWQKIFVEKVKFQPNVKANINYTGIKIR
ncbi:spore germination protein B3 precursor [Clostridium acetireducens DSM 10703]|uniref:Spore germination protein B3 n=1 Tax=Clostridium acetireducens DSM 10703 TaxID=1121290 RepID=A0A1E8EZH5_9CLOT|nr:Ger(x)C family spore germination protein [Clostridium acetireducens]OFI06539.1 spore germination protein B3 precursor [Clostridium acetireducens DSM 10703]